MADAVYLVYEPLNEYKPLWLDIGIVDGPLEYLRIAGVRLPLPFSTRMTVVRLKNGDLFLHSPIMFQASLAGQLQAMGRIRHLVSPNQFHYAHIGEWSRAFPDAVTWASRGVRTRARARGIEVCLLAAVLTAFYMFRMYFLTFRGPARWPHGVTPHESPRSCWATVDPCRAVGGGRIRGLAECAGRVRSFRALPRTGVAAPAGGRACLPVHRMVSDGAHADLRGVRNPGLASLLSLAPGSGSCVVGPPASAQESAVAQVLRG